MAGAAAAIAPFIMPALIGAGTGAGIGAGSAALRDGDVLKGALVGGGLGAIGGPVAGAAFPALPLIGTGVGEGLGGLLAGTAPQVVGQTAGLTTGGHVMPVLSGGSQGLLGAIGPTLSAAGGGSRLLGATNLGITGIQGAQALQPGPIQVEARPSSLGFIPPTPVAPLGNDPELIQLLVQAINNSRRGLA